MDSKKPFTPYQYHALCEILTEPHRRLFRKSERPVMPESPAKALGRLHSLEKRLRRDSAAATAYSGVIRKDLANGYIRRVPDKECGGSVNEWYLPHFTIKIRLPQRHVWFSTQLASAKV